MSHAKKATLLLFLLPRLAVAIPLSQAIEKGWENSAIVQGQSTQASLAAGDRWRRFIPNEPQFTLINADDSTNLSYGLSLTMGFPGKALILTQADSARSAQQDAELVGKKQDLAKVIAQAYLDCAGNAALTLIQRENVQDLSTVQNSLKLLYESGHSNQSDTIQAELQLRQARTDQVALEDKTDVSCRKLSDILKSVGVNEKIDSALPDDVDSELIDQLGTVSGDVRRAESAVQVAQANLSTAWWGQLPDLVLSAQRNHYLYLPGSPSGKEWTDNFSVSLVIPVLFPFHETVEARRTRSQAQIDEGLADIQFAQAAGDVEDGAREYRRSRARLEELRQKDLSMAEALRDSVLSAYRAGKVGFADLVLARKTYSDLKAQEIQLKQSIINSHLRCLGQCVTLR